MRMYYKIGAKLDALKDEDCAVAEKCPPGYQTFENLKYKPLKVADADEFVGTLKVRRRK